MVNARRISTGFIFLFLVSSLVSSAVGQTKSEPLLRDTFTAPAKDRSTQGKVELVAGQGGAGKAFRLSGVSQIKYSPSQGKIDPMAGEASFRIALNFDPMEKNTKTKTVLRNQSFFTVTGPGYTEASFYNCGRDNFGFAVFNKDRNLASYVGFQQVWKPNQWHQVSLRWGRTLEIWCDGEKKASRSWTGLFGPIPVDLEASSIVIGTVIGRADIYSEFTVADFAIKGPQPDQIPGRPRIALPRLSGAPVLDGRLDDAFWTEAARATGFVKFDKNELVNVQPALLAAYTDQGLYIALDAPMPPGSTPRAMLRERDAPGVSLEDSLEILLQPVQERNAYYHFIASALGTQYDCKTADQKTDINGYTPPWQVKTQMETSRWTAEVFIPFTALEQPGRPKDETVWRANFCLDRATGYGNAAVWSYTAGDYNQPMYFGELVFTGTSRTLRQAKFNGFMTGEPEVSFDLMGDYQPIITVHGELYDSMAKAVYQGDQLLRDAKSVVIKPSILSPGVYTMNLSAQAAKAAQPLFSQSFRFQVVRAFSVTAENFPYRGELQIQADAQGMKTPAEKVACRLLGPDGKLAGACEIRNLTAGKGETAISNEKLAPGVYRVEATAMAADGRTLDHARQDVQIFPHPTWWKSRLGIDHLVPPPYQPVSAAADRISVWGRDFMFGQSVFPQQIVNQKTPMFAARPEFHLQAEGQSLDVGAMAGRRTQTFPDAVVLQGQGRAGHVQATCTSTVEFDGFTRYDLTLSAPQPATVDSLTLTLTLPKDRARFLLTSSGASGATCAVDKAKEMAFCPYLWLGNDHGGLAWFAESDEFWTPKSQQMIQVVPGEKTVTLKLNFVTRPLALREPITITFGLMPSPVGPYPGTNPYTYNLGGEEYTNITNPEYLVYSLAKQPQARQGTLEFWLRRMDRTPKTSVDIFSLTDGKTRLECFISDALYFNLGQQKLLSAPLAPQGDNFSHFAVVWDPTTLAIYQDGKRIAKLDGSPAEKFKRLLAANDGQLRFGDTNDAFGYTGIVLDEIRLSSAVRYTGEAFSPPTEPFKPDADTLLLDPLDDTFKPDGQDAQTAGGGIPSIGCVFEQARFHGGLKLQVKPPRPVNEVLQELGVTLTLRWFLQDYAKFGWPPVLFSEAAPDLKAIIADRHQHGIRVIPYMAYPALSSKSGPLVAAFGPEWSVRPLSTLAEQDYVMHNSCLKAQGFADYMAAGTAWVMDKFGFDGFYSDGLTQVYACQNAAHGCGYRDAAGNRQSTYPIFAVRDTLKRMYRIVKSKNPRGIVVNHASFNLLLPTLSFSDIIYTGEHEDYEDILNARLRFSGRPWGLCVFTLGSSQHTYSPVHTMASLLNGSAVWTMGMVGRGDMGRKDVAMRRAYAAFDVSSAAWVPWYEGNGVYFTVNDPKVNVSLYYHRGRDILMLAGNYNAAGKDTVIRLAADKFDLANQPLVAANALTGQDIPVTAEGSLTVHINPKSFVLLRVKRK